MQNTLQAYSLTDRSIPELQYRSIPNLEHLNLSTPSDTDTISKFTTLTSSQFDISNFFNTSPTPDSPPVPLEDLNNSPSPQRSNSIHSDYSSSENVEAIEEPFNQEGYPEEADSLVIQIHPLFLLRIITTKILMIII